MSYLKGMEPTTVASIAGIVPSRLGLGELVQLSVYSRTDVISADGIVIQIVHEYHMAEYFLRGIVI